MIDNIQILKELMLRIKEQPGIDLNDPNLFGYYAKSAEYEYSDFDVFINHRIQQSFTKYSFIIRLLCIFEKKENDR